MSPSVSDFLKFLYGLFYPGDGSEGVGYSAINTARSAVSTIASLEGAPAGQHKDVCQFMKAVFQSRPALPRYSKFWDPDVVLDYIKGLGRNKELSVKVLSQKLVVLMVLQSGQRLQTLHSFDVRYMEFDVGVVTFRIMELLKTSRPGSHVSEVSFHVYELDRRLCVVSSVKAYLRRTLDDRGTVKQLFLTSRAPFRAAARATLGRWMKSMLLAAGVDKYFGPGSGRGASLSKLTLKGVSEESIIKMIGWSNSSVFGRYYNKPLVQGRCFVREFMD